MLNATFTNISVILQGFQYFPVYQYFTVYRHTFYKNLNNFHEYLVQHSLKSGGTKDHFKRVKVPGTAPYCKP